MYRPTEPPQSDIKAWVYEELLRIAGQAKQVELDELHAAPDKPRDGLLVLADGTDWNPGSGRGVYCYYGGAWHYLG